MHGKISIHNKSTFPSWPSQSRSAQHVHQSDDGQQAPDQSRSAHRAGRNDTWRTKSSYSAAHNMSLRSRSTIFGKACGRVGRSSCPPPLPASAAAAWNTSIVKAWHRLDGALERREIVQVPDQCRVVADSAPLPREDAPGERSACRPPSPPDRCRGTPAFRRGGWCWPRDSVTGSGVQWAAEPMHETTSRPGCADGGPARR